MCHNGRIFCRYDALVTEGTAYIVSSSVNSTLETFKGRFVAKKKQRPLHPPVSEMIPIAITKMADHPRKGSSLAAIKSYMSDVWGVDTKQLAKKIKNYIINAVNDGELKQTR